jgi:hypothetical protein
MALSKQSKAERKALQSMTSDPASFMPRTVPQPAPAPAPKPEPPKEQNAQP